jgi:hypothetical protein
VMPSTTGIIKEIRELRNWKNLHNL